MAIPPVNTIYGLHNREGQLVSHGPDEKRLWLDEVQKSFPEIDGEDRSEFLAAVQPMMMMGWTMHEYKRVR